MKRTIRMLALLLVLAMSFSVIAGCSNSSSDNKSQATNAPSTNTNTQPGDASEPSQPSEPEGDGKVKGSITVMTYDRGNMPTSEGTLNDNRWTTWIRENAPVEEINWIAIPKAEAPETMSAQFAGGTAPDLLPNYESLLPFAQNGMCMEITDEMLAKMPNYSAMLEAYPMMEKSSSVDGKRLFFCKFSNILPNHTVVIRQDWLDNLGLDLPETPEDLYNIIYAFTYSDPDGNGVNDTWGINMTTDAQRVLAHMFGFGNPCKYDFDENGELYYVWDRIESWLGFVKQIVDNKCVNPDFVTMKGDDDQADFLSGKIGIYCSGRFCNASRLTLFRNFKTNFPDATLNTFALPETQYGKFTGYLNGGSSNVGFINADLDPEKLDAVLAFSDWLYDPEVSEYLFYGADGDYYKKDEYGTYAIVNQEKMDTEFTYASDYSIMKNELLYGSEENIDVHANDWYNQYLTSDDPILWEFGDLYYKMCVIANEPGVNDPRKWLNDGLPQLDTALSLINTADTEVNNILKAAISNSSITAAQAVQDAKDAWYNAGGQQVDDYYKEYYKTAGDSALLASDFTNAKSMPVMTEAAKKNSKLFN